MAHSLEREAIIERRECIDRMTKQGFTAQEIAWHLQISRRTVERQRGHIQAGRPVGKQGRSRARSMRIERIQALASKGFRTQRIAELLSVSIRTVKRDLYEA